MDYSSFKVVDLKRELKSRGLSVAGNKDELVERLKTYTQSLLGTGSDIDGFSESMNETDILDEDGVLDELDYEEEVLKKINSENESGAFLPNDVSVNSDNSSLNVTVIPAGAEEALPPREPRIQQKCEKKVQLVRNRSLSLLSDCELKENTKLEENIDRKTSEDTSNGDGTAKILLKSTAHSSQERLELRKRKFGVVDEESRKAARAARFGITDTTGNIRGSSKKKSSAIDSSSDLNESVDALKQRAKRFGIAVAPALEKTKTLEALKSRAERFGIVSSPLLKKVSEEEKREARKNRFLSGATTATEEEKKKLRAERFGVSS